MTDSTVKNLNALSGASPAGLQSTDLFYVVRPGSPDADFKAAGSDVTALAAGAAPVQSVAGRTGNVTITTSDIGGLGTIATQAADSVVITGGSITGLSAPSGGSDAATKSYVDAATAGLSQRSSCRVATTGNLSATYGNGSSGVGATLTNNAAQAVIGIDGVTLSTGDRVLVRSQSSSAQNGIYTVTTVGDGTHNWVLTRAADFDAAAANEIVEGAYAVIEEGTANAGTIWLETGSGPFTVGTTGIAFTELSVAPQTVTLTGDVTGAGAGSIALAIGAGKVTNAMLAGSIAAGNLVGTDITTVGTITAGTWSASTIAVGKGGTGATSFTANAVLVGNTTGALQASPVTIDATTGAIAGFATSFNSQTGTTYTLASSDSGKTVTCNNAGAVTVTLPNSLASGFTCEIIQLGAGQVTFSAASGATLNNRQSQSKIAGQNGAVRLTVTSNSGGTSAIYNLAGDTA